MLAQHLEERVIPTTVWVAHRPLPLDRHPDVGKKCERTLDLGHLGGTFDSIQPSVRMPMTAEIHPARDHESSLVTGEVQLGGEGRFVHGDEPGEQFACDPLPEFAWERCLQHALHVDRLSIVETVRMGPLGSILGDGVQNVVGAQRFQVTIDRGSQLRWRVGARENKVDAIYVEHHTVANRLDRREERALETPIVQDRKDGVEVFGVAVIKGQQGRIGGKSFETVTRCDDVFHPHDRVMGGQVVQLTAEAVDLQPLDARIARSCEVAHVVVHHDRERLRRGHDAEDTERTRCPNKPIVSRYLGDVMNVPLAVPNLDGREAEYLLECIESTFVSSAGPFVTRFQDRIAEISGTDRAAVTCSGTVALHMALEGLGIGDGDLVMVPSLTFIASTNAVRHSGAGVWLVDCRDDDWTLDLRVARDVIEAETEPHPRGRRHIETGEVLTAIMPVMIMGATLDFASFVSFADEFGLKVVVDAAAAIGAEGHRAEPLGATGVDAVCYSFNGNKTVTSGGGGAVAATDTSLVERIDHLISTGRVGSAYEHDVVAYNFRMTNVEAAIGVAQLERLPWFLQRKTEIFESYRGLARRYDDVSEFPTPADGRSTHWFSGIVYTGSHDDFCPAFRAHMVERGIDARPFWKPVHLQVPYRNSIHTKMDISEHIWERIVPLPCSTGITDEELRYVVQTAAEFCDRHANRTANG